MTSTLVIILFSNLVIGPLTKPVLVWCVGRSRAPRLRLLGRLRLLRLLRRALLAARTRPPVAPARP